jgi:hypothetical protein
MVKFFLNFKRNANISLRGEPDTNVLQTGMGKPLLQTLGSYVGMSNALANSTLLADGFIPVQRGAPAGIVAAQSPSAGLQVALGSYIYYDVV